MDVRCVCRIAAAMTALLLSFSSDALYAQERPGNLGLGGQLGDPSGVSLRWYQREDLAYDFLGAWDLDRFFFINAHVLYERPVPESPLRYFFGPGGVIGIQDGQDGSEFVLGISFQGGVNFFVEQFEVFLQLTPRLNLIPETEGEFGGGIGLRYYFQ